MMLTKIRLECVSIRLGCVSKTRLYLFILLGVVFNTHALADRSINLWSENFRLDANVEILKLALEKAASRYGEIQLQQTDKASYEQAFDRLAADTPDFDLVISALNIDREKKFLPVYFPLDRGLLGFRICIVSGQALDNFAKVRRNQDFGALSLKVTLDAEWPDAIIMQENQIPILPVSSHQGRLDLVQQSDNTCYSRSIVEIEAEIAQVPSLRVENSFVMIYPEADILYFRKGAKDLAEAVKYGLEEAYQDGSFLAVFEKHYSATKQRFSLYDRKLLIMSSPILSNKGREAVNRYGLFSFIKQ